VQVESSATLNRLISNIARQRGRAEEEVLEEAVVRSRREMGVEDADPFLDLLRRMRSRFDYDPDEAVQIAVREQHAARQERRERAER
jgi:hypothetical protein